MATFQKREKSNGTITYRAQIRMTGHPHISKTFKRLTDAKTWARQLEEEIDKGVYVEKSEARKHTLADAIDRYLASLTDGAMKDLEGRKSHLVWWSERAGHLSFIAITPSLLAQIKAELAATPITPKPKQKKKDQPLPTAPVMRKPATVNRYLAALGPVLTAAAGEWQWIIDNSMHRIKKFTEPRGRVRFLVRDEQNRSLEACRKSKNPYLYAITVLAITTGMRKEEITELTWNDIYFDRKRIIIHDTKNNDRRSAPLVDPALSELLRLTLQKAAQKVKPLSPLTKLVFPGKVSQTKPTAFRTAWLRSVSSAKLHDFRFHDLRHTAASNLAMNGATLSDISAILGHKTLAMVKRYAHLTENHTTAVVQRMAEQVFG